MKVINYSMQYSWNYNQLQFSWTPPEKNTFSAPSSPFNVEWAKWRIVGKPPWNVVLLRANNIDAGGGRGKQDEKFYFFSERSN